MISHKIRLVDCLASLREINLLIEMALDTFHATESDAKKLIKLYLLLEAYQQQVLKLYSLYEEED